MSELKLTLVGLMLLATTAHAQLSEREAVQQTIEHNPTVRAAVTDVKRAAETLRAENARYRPKLLLDATGTNQNTPNLNTVGSTTTQLNQSLTLGAEVDQTFSWGTTLSLRVENKDYRSQGPLFGGSTDVFTLGPGYLLGAKLAVTQPLLRGFGDDVGLAALRTATLDKKESERARDESASTQLSTMLQAYWELWYAQRALTIDVEARAVAVQQRDEARLKVKAGSAADVDVLQYETRVAELDQTVLDATVTVRTRSVELARVLGSSDAQFDLSGAELPSVDSVEDTRALSSAEEASYSVKRAKVSLERAQTTMKSAADSTRPRLDVSAWVQTQGLGNQSFEGTFTQLGQFTNVSGNVGLTFELPLSGEQHEAQVSSARLAVTSAEQSLEAALAQVRADTRTEVTNLSQASQKVSLAETTAEVSSRSADAQRKRLSAGTGTSLEVRQAEDSLRQARLSIERHKVDAVKAQVRLAHLTGDLLVKWGVVQ